MMRSKKDKSFIFNEFKIGEITWNLAAYEQNQSHSSMLERGLKSIDISTKWNKIIITENLYCFETLPGDTPIFIFNSIELQISLNHIKNMNMNELTLCIDIEIIEIISNNNDILCECKLNIASQSIQQQPFKWNLNKIQLKTMKDAYKYQYVLCRIYWAMDGE